MSLKWTCCLAFEILPLLFTCSPLHGHANAASCFVLLYAILCLKAPVFLLSGWKNPLHTLLCWHLCCCAFTCHRNPQHPRLDYQLMNSCLFNRKNYKTRSKWPYCLSSRFSQYSLWMQGSSAVDPQVLDDQCFTPAHECTTHSLTAAEEQPGFFIFSFLPSLSDYAHKYWNLPFLDTELDPSMTYQHWRKSSVVKNKGMWNNVHIRS